MWAPFPRDGYRREMDFELSDELAELQTTVRRLAQDKVKPRAREIDDTGEYPQDLFEIFRDAGLLGLCIPEAYGGAGGGVMGVALGTAGGGKNSHTPPPLLLLAPPP